MRKVTPKSFTQSYYDNAVKGFIEKKEEYLKQERERKDLEEQRELTFKPELSPNRRLNSKERAPLLDRLSQFQAKSEARIKKMRDETARERELEESRESTFRPKINRDYGLGNESRRAIATAEKDPFSLLAKTGERSRSPISASKVVDMDEDFPPFKPTLNDETEKLAVRIVCFITLTA